VRDIVLNGVDSVTGVGKQAVREMSKLITAKTQEWAKNLATGALNTAKKILLSAEMTASDMTLMTVKVTVERNKLLQWAPSFNVMYKHIREGRVDIEVPGTVGVAFTPRLQTTWDLSEVFDVLVGDTLRGGSNEDKCFTCLTLPRGVGCHLGSNFECWDNDNPQALAAKCEAMTGSPVMNLTSCSVR